MERLGVMPGQAVFRREGEYWTIVYQDTVLRLRDSRGLRYIAHLLRHPGTRFAARDLMQAVQLENPTPDTRHPIPFPDERARLAVTKRIKAAVKNVDAHHAALAYHLRTTVKTGAYCVYLPDPERPIVWRS